MSLISDYLSKNLTAVTKEQLSGANRIFNSCFYEHTKLKSIGIPYSVKVIEIDAFVNCSALAEIDTDSMDPFCEINSVAGRIAFFGTAWVNNQPANSMFTMANGQILVGNNISAPSNGFVIPSTVKNIAGAACGRLSGSADSLFTSVVIPDTVEMIQRNIFEGQTSLTKITVGSGVRKITGLITPGTNMKEMIFRQPAGMTIELPTPGANDGMAYNKDAYSMNIYTDNEYIRNYGWSTDNVTATFYPLSSAPN